VFKYSVSCDPTELIWDSICNGGSSLVHLDSGTFTESIVRIVQTIFSDSEVTKGDGISIENRNPRLVRFDKVSENKTKRNEPKRNKK
jgi:hypothetical protein